MQHRSNEPIFWSVFSAGGVVTALFAPALIIVAGFLVPARDVHFSRLSEIFTNPFGRIVIFGLALLTFFHWAHRFRHTLTEVGLRPLRVPVAVICYLVAVGATIWAGIIAFT